ncbi:hypothetical protein [Winogradskyella sp. A3E31]|uniref:hypothetical protein n=1 Tax=Winogradskyella sp. A3E31 TaxID=3349637 RepID=UPI00398B8D14
MCNQQEIVNHSKIQKIFEDVFFVTGTMKNEFFGSMWQFSRNMTIVREDGNLSIFNSVKLNEDGLKALDELGKVTNVVRIGDMHGIDDEFYIKRYNAKFWALPDMTIESALKIDEPLIEGNKLPIKNASLFIFNTVKRPECIIRLDKEGGIMIACDSLQNWEAPDEFFDESTIKTMKQMNFFQSANLGPAWMHESQPQKDDFVRLKDIQFKHALCGHGTPLLHNAQQAFQERFKQAFNI